MLSPRTFLLSPTFLLHVPQVPIPLHPAPPPPPPPLPLHAHMHTHCIHSVFCYSVLVPLTSFGPCPHFIDCHVWNLVPRLDDDYNGANTLHYGVHRIEGDYRIASHSSLIKINKWVVLFWTQYKFWKAQICMHQIGYSCSQKGVYAGYLSWRQRLRTSVPPQA